MNTNSHNDLKIPTLQWLPLFYRFLLRLTRRHGLFTLARRHVKLFPRGQNVRIPNGGLVFLPPDSHFFGFLTGLHEEHITRLLPMIIRPGDTCIDVGANIGYFSSMMASVTGENGKVIAFEPEPGNFSILSHNSTRNTQQSAHIQPVHAAVSDQSGTICLVHGEESTLHQVKKGSPGSPDDLEVPATTLDSLFSEVSSDQIAVIKIDVEGHELAVLEGADRLLTSGIVRNLIIEVTPGPDATAIEEILKMKSCSTRAWVSGKWSNTTLSDLCNRTDVWVSIS